MSRLKDICVDCGDPWMLAHSWAAVLGYRVRPVKNRIHIDVFGEVEELLERGASMIEPQGPWTVMADPEGNEFCVFPS